ncbi:hypothetical protein VTJ49DRAFT_2817 [Mycothermus thermophilus]|uniref:Uncharacterized protein n=1 Tax=Humicola insolens TaxID=85995 RepID=A0ABR3V908_HUMIN
MMYRSSSRTSASALSLFLLANTLHHAAAIPYPRDQHNAMLAAGYGYLLPRQGQCHQHCGHNNMYCCDEGTQCYTSNGIAGCSAYAGGGWAWYTTTWTVTQTFTRTYNSWIPAATGPSDGGDCVPPPGSGQIACGKICCASWQYCAYEGQCMANNPGAVPTTYTSDGVTITTQFSPPWRVTSSTVDGDGPTPTGDDPAATDTAGVVVPGDDTTTEEGGGGLSGGAIAGIVIGTIAGVALLLLICACCVIRGLWHGVMAVLGFGKKKDSDRSSIHSNRDNHSSWYGGRPSSAGARKEKKKGAGLLGLGALLGTLALLLGLRRDKKKRQGGSTIKTRSDVSSSYFSDSYTGTSSRSSDRRTRHSRRSSRHGHSRTPSRVTRTTHTTHTHTRLSRAPSARSARSARSPRP